MHIRRLRIQDIRSITDLNVEIPDPRAGWHVILGENGSGKSSVIRAMALALMGPLDATATRQNWQDWIRKTASSARVELEVAPDAEFDKWKRTGRRAKQPITVTVTFPPQAPVQTRRHPRLRAATPIARSGAEAPAVLRILRAFRRFPEATRNTTGSSTAIPAWRATSPPSEKTWPLAKH